jgi:hypothetical protein
MRTLYDKVSRFQRRSMFLCTSGIRRVHAYVDVFILTTGFRTPTNRTASPHLRNVRYQALSIYCLKPDRKTFSNIPCIVLRTTAKQSSATIHDKIASNRRKTVNLNPGTAMSPLPSCRPYYLHARYNCPTICR